MKKIILTLILVIFVNLEVHASKLPDDIWDYVKTSIPKATQRFDSVVIVSDRIMYVPLSPPQIKNVEKLKITYTYPQNKTLKNLPEVVVFNNDYVLLKLFQDTKGNYMITQNENLPFEVKLGLMPQDMLVPVGLKIPDSLKLILGDLSIPTIQEEMVVLDETKPSKKLSGQINTNEIDKKSFNFYALNDLKGKKAYITTNGSKFMSVYDESSSKPLYEFKLSALPLKLVASNEAKFGIILYYGENLPEIIDLRDEKILGKIENIIEAKDVIIDDKRNFAYFACPNSNAIFVVDMFTKDIKSEIKMSEQPYKLAFNEDKTAITYIDYRSQNLYVLNLKDEFETHILAKTDNVSDVIYNKNIIYTISRTSNKLRAINAETGDLENEVKLHTTPVNSLYYKDKIFILCAKDGFIDVYDTKEKKITKTIALDKKGFYSKLTKTPNYKTAFVTGIETKQFAVVDLEEDKIMGNKPIEIQVSNMVVIDK